MDFFESPLPQKFSSNFNLVIFLIRILTIILLTDLMPGRFEVQQALGLADDMSSVLSQIMGVFRKITIAKILCLYACAVETFQNGYRSCEFAKHPQYLIHHHEYLLPWSFEAQWSFTLADDKPPVLTFFTSPLLLNNIYRVKIIECSKLVVPG